MLVSRLLLTAVVAVFATAAVASGLDRLSRDAPGLERMVPIHFEPKPTVRPRRRRLTERTTRQPWQARAMPSLRTLSIQTQRPLSVRP